LIYFQSSSSVVPRVSRIAGLCTCRECGRGTLAHFQQIMVRHNDNARANVDDVTSSHSYPGRRSIQQQQQQHQNDTHCELSSGGSSSNPNGSYYEMIEEECLETLSDDGVPPDLLYSIIQQQQQQQQQQDEIYEEEEVIEYVEEEIVDSAPMLPGISEGDEEEEVEDVADEVIDTDDDDNEYEYDEVEVVMNGSQSVNSGTEVEFLESEEQHPVLVETQRGGGGDDDDSDYEDGTIIVEELVMDDDDENDLVVVVDDGDSVVEVEYVDHTIRDGSDADEELTIREVHENSHSEFCQSDRSFRNSSNHSSKYDYEDVLQNPEDDGDDGSSSSSSSSSIDENGGASAEELTEAIEYVLRQERAVSKFILTEEQAAKMAHLPIKVMKIIVDHLEVCDNEQTPIDWDFLLKIVLPFCENDLDI
jgi:hypothetical protein